MGIQGNKLSVRQLLAAACLICCAESSYSEIIADGTIGTLPAGSTISGNMTLLDSYGEVFGANLFYSADTFNINTGESVTINGNSAITNIITRVTGGNTSTIDGILTSTIPSADFWLLNPAGIIFGNNASLNLQGSFYASTADYIEFTDGSQMYADTAQASNLVSFDPVAFGFVDGVISPITLNEAKLTVTNGNSITLVGGDITLNGSGYDNSDPFNFILNGSELYAQNGNIKLAGIAQAGEVNLAAQGIDTGAINTFGNINMNYSVLKADGDGSGGIYIKAGDFVFQGEVTEAMMYIDMALIEYTNSTTIDSVGKIDIDVDSFASNRGIIRSINTSTGVGSDININVNNIASFFTSSTDWANSGVYSDAQGSGDGGDIIINASQLSLTDRSGIHSYTQQAGQGGDILINDQASSINLTSMIMDSQGHISQIAYGSGNTGNTMINVDGLLDMSTEGGIIGFIDSGNYTSIYNEVKSGASGNAGIVTINADEIHMTEDAYIFGRTYGSGNAGSLYLNASSEIRIKNNAQVFMDSFGIGYAGDIIVNTSLFNVFNDFVPIPGQIISTDAYNGGFFSAIATDDGNAGNISVTADNVYLHNSTFNTNTGARGLAGDIVFTVANNMTMENSTIHSSSINNVDVSVIEGRAGNILILASDLQMSDSAINAFTLSDGMGGSIQLDLTNLYMTTGSKESGLNAYTSGSGNAGAITVNVSDVISMQEGEWGNVRCGLGLCQAFMGNQISSSATSTGSAGIIEINTSQLQLIDGARINASASDAGNAGSINITMGSLDVQSGAYISASTSGAADAGTISVTASGDIVVSGSKVFDINTGEISISRIEGISTGATSGAAGNVMLTANNISLDQQGAINASTESADTTNQVANIDLIATNSINMASGTSISTNTSGDVNAGAITLNAVLLNNSGEISASTSGNGAAGVITLTADTVNIDAGDVRSSTSSSGSGGAIAINATDINLINDSNISSTTTGTGDAGEIDINAISTFTMGQADNASQSSLSSYSLGSEFLGLDKGSAGTISVAANDINILAGSIMASTNSNRTDNTAASVNLIATNNLVFINSSITTQSTGVTDAGNILLSGNNVLLSEGLISAKTEASGLGGDVTIMATDQLMQGAFISSNSFGSGRAGNILLSGDSIIVNDDQVPGSITGGVMTSSSYSTGNGGNITLNAANAIELKTAVVSAISSDDVDPDAGDAGNIELNAGELTIGNDTVTMIMATTDGAGNAGQININAVGDIAINEGIAIAVSSFGESVGAGRGGDINIIAGGTITGKGLPSFEDIGHGRVMPNISTESFGEGAGGNVSISANQLYLADGFTTSVVALGSGNGGSITFNANDIDFSNGVTVTASSSGSGNAGNINLLALNNLELDGASITTNSNNSSGGSIKLYAPNYMFIENTDITAEAHGVTLGNDGGNISIDPVLLFINNSNIVANANAGNGGNIDIIAHNMIISPDTTIDASSNTGLDGDVVVDSPNQYLGTDAAQETTFLDISSLMNNSCVAAQRQRSSFTTEERSYLYFTPDRYMPSSIESIINRKKEKQAEVVF